MKVGENRKRYEVFYSNEIPNPRPEFFYTTYTEANTNNELQNGLGAGWSFGFSYIETDGSDKFLHLSSGDAYKINITSAADDSNLDKYTLKDIRLENDSGSYSNGTVSSSSILIHTDDKKEYFASDGRLIGIVDRFGNSIKFEHSQINGRYVITKITDTVGRVVNISYQNDGTGKIITVSASDGTSVQYKLVPIDGCSGEYKLAQKIDQNGKITAFDYAINSGNFSFFSKTSRSTGNKFACLTGITYPTGGQSSYTYEGSVRNLGNQGTEEYYRVKTRCETDGTKNYNSLTYGFSSNDYTGYPANTDPTSLPDTYTYSSTVTDSDGTVTTYTMNNKNLVINEDTKENGTTEKKNITYEYNTNKLPVKVVSKTYNSSGSFMQAVQNYAYDDYRNVLGSWDVRNDRDSSNNTTNNEHKTTCTYDDEYGLLTGKTYKKDANTTISEVYTLTSDKKNIEWAKVSENGVLKKQSRYTYDTYGNVTEERNYLDNGTDYVSTNYSYDDNDTSRNGQFNGLFVTRKWTGGITGAAIMEEDEKLFADKTGKNPVVIEEIYKYNLSGRLVEKHDGNGNVAKYEYDAGGRLNKQINPDLTYKTYSYTTSTTESSILVTDEKGTQLKHKYDKFGNLLFEQDVKTGEYLNSRTYDNNFRLETESNINSSPNGSTITYTYYKDGRLHTKETRDKSNVLIAQESYDYDDAFNNGQYAKTTKTILGDANSPSIVTTSYANNAGLTEKQGRIHNGTEYTDTFKYDYVGNKTEDKIARAYDESWGQTYTTKYDYNYAGQIVKTTLADGKYSVTGYNALGQKAFVTDFKQNTTNYYYDNVGRLIKEEIPFENTSKTLKMHCYDRNGNVVAEIVRANKPGNEILFSMTGYEYNSLNLLTKVTTYKTFANIYKTFEDISKAAIPVNYTQYYYDGVGNKVRMYTGLTSPLTITGLDQVTPGSDKSYSVTKYDYDRFGNLLTMTDPLNKTESYVYNTNGTLKQKTDRNKNVTSMTYDGLGRLLTSTVTTPDGSGNKSLAYTYALTGNKWSSASGTASTSYLYDDLGRLTTESAINITKEYTYDAADNRKSLVIKQNGAIKTNTTYIYDRKNRLEKVSEGGVLKATYTYDDNGNRKSLTYDANGNSTVYDYNLANKLKTLTNKKGTDTISQYTISQYTYAYSLVYLVSVVIIPVVSYFVSPN
ncbi:MAG TPA: hypothetical protein VHT34_09180, partial [Clostridia bacterium]|nr:hypothetical protein [Clostridia bacterium]